MTGGSAPYQKGAREERAVKAEYEAAGWFVVRCPASKSAIDLLCVHPSPSGLCLVHFVQVKSEGYLRPAERVAVTKLANHFGGTPVLAWRVKGRVHRRNISSGRDLNELSRDTSAGRADSSASPVLPE